MRFVGGRADSAPSLKTIVSINENGSPLAPIGEDVSKTPSYSGSSKDNRRNYYESQRKVTYQERKEEKEAKKKEIFAKNVVNVLTECGIDVKPVKEVYSDNLVEPMPLNSVSMKSVRYRRPCRLLAPIFP